MSDLAIQGIGCASVGIYPTSPSAEVEYLLGHSRAVVLIAEDEEQLDKVLAVRHNLPHLRRIVIIDTRGTRRHRSDPMIITFAEFEALGAERPVTDWAEQVRSVAARRRRHDRVHLGDDGTAWERCCRTPT
jgi:long-chain acyl-CoA synthetase